MNGYELIKSFYDRVAENEEMQLKCKTQHLALYTWISELHNRTKRTVMDLARDYTMSMSFIGSATTYKETLEDLNRWGLIEIIQRGTNQHHPTKIKFACTESYQQDTSTIRATTPAGTQATSQASYTTKRDESPESLKDLNNKTGSAAKPEQKKAVKVAYREHVLLTESEHEVLVTKHGKDVTERILDKLDAFKLSKNKTYASDYGAINTWVVNAVMEDQQRSQSGRQYSNSPPRPAPVDDTVMFGEKATPEQIEARKQAYLNRNAVPTF